LQLGIYLVIEVILPAIVLGDLRQPLIFHDVTAKQSEKVVVGWNEVSAGIDSTTSLQAAASSSSKSYGASGRGRSAAKPLSLTINDSIETRPRFAILVPVFARLFILLNSFVC
jgi:hypothetical protein